MTESKQKGIIFWEKNKQKYSFLSSSFCEASSHHKNLLKSSQWPLAHGTAQPSPFLRMAPLTLWLLVGCCCALSTLPKFCQHPVERNHFIVQTSLGVERNQEDQQYNWSIGGIIYQRVIICSQLQISPCQNIRASEATRYFNCLSFPRVKCFAPKANIKKKKKNTSHDPIPRSQILFSFALKPGTSIKWHQSDCT